MLMLTIYTNHCDVAGIERYLTWVNHPKNRTVNNPRPYHTRSLHLVLQVGYKLFRNPDGVVCSCPGFLGIQQEKSQTKSEVSIDSGLCKLPYK